MGDDFEDTYTSTTDHGPDFDTMREEVSAKLREAQIYSRQGKSTEAIAILKDVLAQATAPRDLAATHFYLAACYMAREEWDKARVELEEAIPIAERIGDRELLERSRNELGNAFEAQGKHLLALECHRTCYEAIRRGIMRDPMYRLNVLGSLGHEYWELGEFDKAIEVLKEAAELSNDVLNPEKLGNIYWMLSASYSAQGDTARAKRYALHSIQAFEEVGNKKQASYVHSRLGRAYLQSNSLEDAEVHLSLAHDMATKLDDPHGVSDSSRSLSELHLRRKEYDEAEREARAALTAAERQRDTLARAEALLAMGEAFEARGKKREADAQIKLAVTAFEQANAPRQLADAYHRLATLYKQRNDHERAYDMLERAWQAGGHVHV
jgi:tetratricopeptide (TPR) repeat protein